MRPSPKGPPPNHIYTDVQNALTAAPYLIHSPARDMSFISFHTLSAPKYCRTDAALLATMLACSLSAWEILVLRLVALSRAHRLATKEKAASHKKNSEHPRSQGWLLGLQVQETGRRLQLPRRSDFRFSPCPPLHPLKQSSEGLGLGFRV